MAIKIKNVRDTWISLEIQGSGNMSEFLELIQKHHKNTDKLEGGGINEFTSKNTNSEYENKKNNG